MTRRARRLALLVPAAVLLALSACSDDPGAAGAEPGTAAPAAPTSPPPQLSLGGDPPLVTAPPQTTLPATTLAPTTSPTTLPPTTSPPTTIPPTTVPGPPRTSCTSVIHLGDSTSVSLISPSFIADPEQRVDAQYRRVGALDARTEIDGALSTSETLEGQINAYDRVRNIKADGYEGCWVFALGGNDTANLAKFGGSIADRVARIDRMMSAIGDDPVMWVNVKTLDPCNQWYGNEYMQEWNAALQEALPRYSNMRVFDWASVVQDEWFQDDEIHYTSDGSVMRAALIADALAVQFPA